MLIKLKNDYTKILHVGIFLGLFSLISVVGFAQETRKENWNTSRTNLDKIKNNGLVVTFPTNAPLIEGLESRGLDEKARLEQEEIEKYNAKLVKTFRNYSYGPVFFTNSNDLENANNGDELIVKDINGQLHVLNPSDVLYLNPKRVKMKDHNSTYNGFGIHDKDFKYLDRPFPFFVLKRDGFIIFQKSESQMVDIIQKKFLKFETQLQNSYWQ